MRQPLDTAPLFNSRVRSFFSGRQQGNQRNTRRAVERPRGTGDLNITVIPPRYSDYNGPARLVHTKKEILDEIFDIFHSFTVD
jgi:hypothetical protein